MPFEKPSGRGPHVTFILNESPAPPPHQCPCVPGSRETTVGLGDVWNQD